MATLRVISWNIAHTARANDVAHLVRECRADIVILQEVDQLMFRSGQRDAPHIIAIGSGLHSYYSPTLAFGPNTGPIVRLYGLCILSRWPMIASSSHIVSRATTYSRSRGHEPRILQTIIIDIDGSWLAIHNTHVAHGAGMRQTQRHWQLRSVARHLGGRDAPAAILGGDLNELPEVLLRRNFWLNSGLRPLANGLPTYPALGGSARAQRIDYLASRGLRGGPIKLMRRPLVSDHCALIAEFTYQ